MKFPVAPLYLPLSVAISLGWGCGNGSDGGSTPPPPPPTSTTTAPPEATTSTIPELPPPSPPPPDRADPRDYVSLERIDGIIDGTASAPGLLHGLAFGGWRDPLYVADHCPWAANFLGFVSPDELREFGLFGAALTREGEDFVVVQLRKENRRCDPTNPNFDPRFLRTDGSCAKSEMRKSRLGEYRSRLEPHLEIVDDTRARAATCQAELLERDPITGAYDSIEGWCRVMNRLGLRECRR